MAKEVDQNLIKKLERACVLRFLYNLSWQVIAGAMWPVDEDGHPYGTSKPMFASPADARRVVYDYQKFQMPRLQDEIKSEVCARSSARQRMLLPLMEKGDLSAIAAHRAEDDMLLKIFGAYAPVKVAPTTPDGRLSAPGILVVPAPVDTAQWAAQAITYQDRIRAITIDHKD